MQRRRSEGPALRAGAFEIDPTLCQSAGFAGKEACVTHRGVGVGGGRGQSHYARHDRIVRVQLGVMKGNPALMPAATHAHE